MHPRHQPFKSEEVYIFLYMEGAGTSMSDTGGLIVYKIIGWKITTMEIKGGAWAPWAPPWIRPWVEGIKIYIKKCLYPTKKRILISNFNIFKST